MWVHLVTLQFYTWTQTGPVYSAGLTWTQTGPVYSAGLNSAIYSDQLSKFCWHRFCRKFAVKWWVRKSLSLLSGLPYPLINSKLSWYLMSQCHHLYGNAEPRQSDQEVKNLHLHQAEAVLYQRSHLWITRVPFSSWQLLWWLVTSYSRPGVS